MKECPHCSSPLVDTAVRCKHCRRPLDYQGMAGLSIYSKIVGLLVIFISYGLLTMPTPIRRPFGLLVGLSCLLFIEFAFKYCKNYIKTSNKKLTSTHEFKKKKRGFIISALIVGLAAYGAWRVILMDLQKVSAYPESGSDDTARLLIISGYFFICLGCYIGRFASREDDEFSMNGRRGFALRSVIGFIGIGIFFLLAGLYVSLPLDFVLIK